MNEIKFDWLYEQARARFASDAALESFLPTAKNPAGLKKQGDDRYLSLMTRRVFRAGMTHKVVDGRWRAFEEILWGFDPEKMVLLSAEQIEGFARDERLIRHMTKMRTLPFNAQFILDVRHEHGSFGNFLANWPGTDIVGLWQLLAKRGARLGGNSAPGFLRMAGKDTFLLTTDVVARLVAQGIVKGRPTSRSDLQRVQGIFNELQQSSGRPLCQLSSMLSLTINPRF
jgi:DNA-3-methyladenine glycosylase I